MKRIFAVILTMIVLLTFTVSMKAQDVETFTETEPESVIETEEQTEEQTTEAKTEEQTDIVAGTEAQTETIDSEKYAQQFIDYVFSGASGSTELMDKIIAMGEQFAEQKEAGYTFEERMKQLITPENMITTVAAAFLLICGIATFIFKKWQKKSNLIMHKEISTLRDKYEKETEENKKLREAVGEQTAQVKELKGLIKGLCERSDISKTDMDHVSHTATAVAKMVKDVFLNSKTIDASGKALLVHNYMEAIGEESEKNE